MTTSKEEFANSVITNYVNKNEVTVPIEIHFVNNINDSWLKYTCNRKVIYEYIMEDFTDYNGLAMPFDGTVYHILIRNDYADYECTIIHECTHVIDYDKFRLLFNNGNIDIYYHEFYKCMALYSEFHARAIAHRYYYDHLSLSIEDITQLYFGEIIEMIPLIKNIENQLKGSNKQNIQQRLYYELMQYLGRIYMYKLDIPPLDDFSDNIKNVYSCLVALDLEWCENNFQTFSLALKQLQHA